MKIFYKTPRATATDGRSGHVSLADETLAFDLTPVDKDVDGKGINPEKLFALGFAACFDSAITHVANAMKLEVTSKTAAEVGIGMTKEGGFALDIDLFVEVSGIDEATAQALVEATDKVCPYSNAVRGNVEVRLHTSVV